MKNIQHEITPINEDDLFIILNHPKADFDYPIHFHSDFELNLVLWDFGRRIVGDSIEPFEEVDLVLTGPNVPHKWEGNNVESNHVITIQFHEQLLTFPILQRKQKFRYCQKNNRHDSNDGIQRLSRILCPTL